MKGGVLLVMAGCALSGCNSPAAEAERAYMTIHKAGGTYADSCSAANRAAAAWASEGNEEKYKRWSEYAELDCFIASACRTGSGVCNSKPEK